MQSGEEQWEEEHQIVLDQFPTMQVILWVTCIHGITEPREGEPERLPGIINRMINSLLRAANLAVCQ